MKQAKTLVLFPEDLKEEFKEVGTFYICLSHFKRVQESKYELILFLDTRAEANILYSTRVLKNKLITSIVKLDENN